MRIACLQIPKSSGSLAGAFLTVKYGLFNSNYFYTQLQEIAENCEEPFSLEFYAADSMVYVTIVAEEGMLKHICDGLYGWFQDIEFREISDYTLEVTDRTIAGGTDLYLHYPDIYPIQTFKDFMWNSCSPMLTALSRLERSDRMLLQMLVRPIKDKPALHASLAFARFKENFISMFRPRTWLRKKFSTNTSKLVRDKCLSRLFRCNYRISAFSELPSNYTGKDLKKTKARLTKNIRVVTDILQYLNTTDQNRIGFRPISFSTSFLRKVQQRRFERPFRFTGHEVATFWHPPTAGGLPNTAQVLSKKAAPPRNLPCQQGDPQISFVGHTNFRDQLTDFGVRRFDRRRHLYILGKSGYGKSCLLQLLIRADIEQGYGCAVLDPHGDLVDDILKAIPQRRHKDVVLFDPSDLQYPPCFNPMIPSRPEQKMRVTLSFIDTFKRVFGAAWSDKMDHLIRYSIMALLSIPGTSIVSLRRLLSDDAFRAEVVSRSTDESVRRFWEVEFASRRSEFEAGPVSQLLNRLDELLATDMMRNILGQPTNSFDFREFIDNRKIVLFKISKGVLGAENASLLGSLIVWKLYEAAMSRADTSVEARQDFYFYVDEFQNFASSSFGEILSESRKYRLCMTFANQYLGQFAGDVKASVFGNIANLISFRTGAEDAGAIANELKPRFAPDDLLNLPLREFYIKMSVDGEVQESFSGRTLDLVMPTNSSQNAAAIIEASRKRYSTPLAQAEELLALSEIMSPRAIGNR